MTFSMNRKVKQVLNAITNKCKAPHNYDCVCTKLKFEYICLYDHAKWKVLEAMLVTGQYAL